MAGFRSRRGASYRLLTLLREGRYHISLSVPLALEYEAVLLRHAKELGFARDEAIGLVDYLCDIGAHHEIHVLWRPTLADPRDEFILELAVAARSDGIVTHNVRDFERAAQFGVRVMAPAECVAAVERAS